MCGHHPAGGGEGEGGALCRGSLDRDLGQDAAAAWPDTDRHSATRRRYGMERE